LGLGSGCEFVADTPVVSMANSDLEIVMVSSAADPDPLAAPLLVDVVATEAGDAALLPLTEAGLLAALTAAAGTKRGYPPLDGCLAAAAAAQEDCGREAGGGDVAPSRGMNTAAPVGDDTFTSDLGAGGGTAVVVGAPSGVPAGSISFLKGDGTVSVTGAVADGGGDNMPSMSTPMAEAPAPAPR
jgi:hypothetical protein